MQSVLFSIFFMAILAVSLVILFKFVIRRTTIIEGEKGLMYVNGKFIKVLEPGAYWFMPLLTIIQKLDIRPRFVAIPGQEILSADGIAIKISLAAHYQIVDPISAVQKAQKFQDSVYFELQLALREIISSADIDTILKNRNELSHALTAKTEVNIQNLGIKLISVNFKDIMFPGKLKEVFAQVVSARQQGLAMLEKARGETAALRSLANAAKMIEANPHLLHMRLVQVLSQSSGNTLVFGMPSASPMAMGLSNQPGTKESRQPATGPD